jgi:hypothetical protein
MVPGELVDCPRRHGGLAELLDLGGRIPIALFLKGTGQPVPSVRELLERESVQLVEFFVPIGHPEGRLPPTGSGGRRVREEG